MTGGGEGGGGHTVAVPLIMLRPSMATVTPELMMKTLVAFPPLKTTVPGLTKRLPEASIPIMVTFRAMVSVLQMYVPFLT